MSRTSLISKNSALALAIDTSTQALVVSIGDKDKLIDSYFLMAGRSHLEIGTKVIKELIKKNKIELKDLGAVFAGLGPGSLIGSRIGVIFAKTLAQVLKVPLIGISTLDSIAKSSDEEGLKIVANDALRNELYWSIYENKKRLSDYKVGPLRDLVQEMKGKEATIIGTALIRYRNEIKNLDNIKIGRTLYPSPEALLEAGFEKLMNEEISSIYDLEPIYLRGPV